LAGEHDPIGAVQKTRGRRPRAEPLDEGHLLGPAQEVGPQRPLGPLPLRAVGVHRLARLQPDEPDLLLVRVLHHPIRLSLVPPADYHIGLHEAHVALPVWPSERWRTRGAAAPTSKRTAFGRLPASRTVKWSPTTPPSSTARRSPCATSPSKGARRPERFLPTA